MHSTSIILLVLGLLASVAMARPGKRPWFGHHYESTENEMSQEQQWSTYRLPSHIRLPHLLVGKLGQPFPTYTGKKILDGKYLLISPALIFKLKEVDTETSTTAVPESSTTDEPDSVETTTIAIDEDTTTDLSFEETTTDIPSFFKKQIFSMNDNEKLSFFDD
jgi:hypothetical protein